MSPSPSPSPSLTEKSLDFGLELEISNSNSRKSTDAVSRFNRRPNRQIYRVVRYQTRPVMHLLHSTGETTDATGTRVHSNSTQYGHVVKGKLSFSQCIVVLFSKGDNNNHDS